MPNATLMRRRVVKRSMMKYSYFPGCSANTTGVSFTRSTEYVADKIGFEMLEIPDWNCCGTSAAALTSPELAVALPARSMAISEREFPELDVVAPCAGCYRSLKTSLVYARESEDNLAHVRELIDMPYEAKADVVSLLEAFVSDDVREAISKKVARKLRCLKVACYYGCAMVRPVDVCESTCASSTTRKTRRAWTSSWNSSAPSRSIGPTRPSAAALPSRWLCPSRRSP